mgnify:FL=1
MRIDYAVLCQLVRISSSLAFGLPWDTMPAFGVSRYPLLALEGLAVASLGSGCFTSRFGVGAHSDSRGPRPVIDFETGVGHARENVALAVSGGLQFSNAPEGDEVFYTTLSGAGYVPVPKVDLPLWAVARGTTGWGGGNAEGTWRMERGGLGILLGAHEKSSVANFLTGHFGGVELSIEVTRQHGLRPAESEETKIWSAGLQLSVGGIGNGLDILNDMLENGKE